MNPSGDNRSLSSSREVRRGRGRETSDVAGAAVRMIRALGRRAAEEDDALCQFRRVREALRLAEMEAVVGLREIGMTDAEIGRELGVTKQAVQKRFPRVERVEVES